MNEGIAAGAFTTKQKAPGVYRQVLFVGIANLRKMLPSAPYLQSILYHDSKSQTIQKSHKKSQIAIFKVHFSSGTGKTIADIIDIVRSKAISLCRFYNTAEHFPGFDTADTSRPTMKRTSF
jgi:hypothetical protein